jgi:hypothetical protein
MVLFMTLALVFGSAEFASRVLLPRISHVQRRINADESVVRSRATAVQNGPATLLIVGNSMMLYALDYPRFVAALSPDIKPVRYAIENTTYLDWYYGLKALFSDGVRPSQVVVCFNLPYTLEHRILGDYSARHLFHARDLLDVARDAGLDNTKTSGLFFAHWSAFYADRVRIRNLVWNVSDPGYVGVMNALAQNEPNPLPPEDEALQEARLRLRAIMKLCQQYHVDLVFLVPPSLKPRWRHDDELLAKAGALENVTVCAPLASGSLGPEYYMDGFHMNEKGAALFTDALARDLKARLGQLKASRRR